VNRKGTAAILVGDSLRHRKWPALLGHFRRAPAIDGSAAGKPELAALILRCRPERGLAEPGKAKRNYPFRGYLPGHERAHPRFGSCPRPRSHSAPVISRR
jgi:hypothetical protein